MEPKFQVNLTTFGYISDWLFWAQSAERKRAFNFYFVKRWWFENGWKGEWRNHANAQRSQRWFQEIKEPSKQAKPTWIQPDPCRSFPNKRSGGRRAKCSHLWQPWNIGRTIAGFHCTVPDFANQPAPCCFLRLLLFFSTLRHVVTFSHRFPPTTTSDPETFEAGSHWGSSVMKSPIGHHVLCGNQALYRLGAPV